jgi:hypothetical protein
MGYLRLNGTFRANLGSHTVHMEVHVYDDNIASSLEWHVMSLQLDAGSSVTSMCIASTVGLTDPVTITNRVQIEAGSKIEICPQAGKYLYDLNLSGLTIDISNVVTGVGVGWGPPSPVEQLHIEVDSPSHKITLQGKGNVFKLLGGVKTPVHLTLQAGTTLIWDPLTWTGNAALSVDLLKDTVKATAESMSFDFDFTRGVFSGTTIFDVR